MSIDRLRTGLVVWWVLTGIAALALVGFAVLSAITVPQSIVVNLIVFAALLGVAAWLALRSSFPVVGAVVAGLAVLTPWFTYASGAIEVLVVLLVVVLVALYSFALVLGIHRRRRFAHRRILRLASEWDAFARHCRESGGLQLWIVSVAHHDQEGWTCAQAWSPATTSMMPIRIGGTWPAQVWICLDPTQQFATAFLSDAARAAWIDLDTRMASTRIVDETDWSPRVPSRDYGER